MSDRKGSKVSIVGTQGYAERTQVAQVDLWRLLVLPFFVQLEIRVRVQREYCRYKAMLNAYGEVARGSVDLWS